MFYLIKLSTGGNRIRMLFYSWISVLSERGANCRGRGRLLISNFSVFSSPVCFVPLPSLYPSSCSLRSRWAFFCFFFLVCLFIEWCPGIGVGTLSLSPISSWPPSIAGSGMASSLSRLCLPFLVVFRVRSPVSSSCFFLFSFLLVSCAATGFCTASAVLTDFFPCSKSSAEGCNLFNLKCFLRSFSIAFFFLLLWK